MKLKLLNEYKRSPMDAQHAMFLAMFLMQASDPAKVQQEVASNFLCQVLSKRLDYYHKEGQPTVSPEVRLFCATLCTGPGAAVLYAHTLHHLALRAQKPYGANELALDFPDGFPNREEMGKAWEAQKAGEHMGGNYLDTPEAWQHG